MAICAVCPARPVHIAQIFCTGMQMKLCRRSAICTGMQIKYTVVLAAVRVFMKRCALPLAIPGYPGIPEEYRVPLPLSLIHISEPTRPRLI
eukprot:143148-Rhodomonas_salina.2